MLWHQDPFYYYRLAVYVVECFVNVAEFALALKIARLISLLGAVVQVC